MPYLVFDSLSGRNYVKIDYGLGIREEAVFQYSLNGDRIVWHYSDGSSKTVWRFRREGSALSLFTDSLLRGEPQVYSLINNDLALTDWTNPVRWDYALPFPPITDWIYALACIDSSWLLLTYGGPGYSTLTRIERDLSSTTLGHIPFAMAMDSKPPFVWFAGRFFIEKRTLADLSVVSRFDVTPYIPSVSLTDSIRGMAVTDSVVYLTCTLLTPNGLEGRLLRFSTSGSFIDSRVIGPYVDELAANNGRLWATRRSSFFLNMDSALFAPARTYYLYDPTPGGWPFIGRHHGIALGNGKLYVADQLGSYLRLFVCDVPS